MRECDQCGEVERGEVKVDEAYYEAIDARRFCRCGRSFKPRSGQTACSTHCGQRRRSRTRYVSGARNLRRWLPRLLHEQDGQCLWCGDDLPLDPWAADGSGPLIQVDHWVPMAEGGSSDLENLAALHRACNQSKGKKVVA